MTTKYGFISDIHQNPNIIPFAMDEFRKHDVKYVLNGDNGEDLRAMEFILQHVAHSGMPTIIQPGSHEKIDDFEPLMQHYTKTRPNIIDAREIQRLEGPDHDLVFIPGSDWNAAGGEYTLGVHAPTGLYARTEEGIVPMVEEKIVRQLFKQKKILGLMNYTNVSDLHQLVIRPEQTVVVCHVPRKFDNIENCIDMAYFAEREDKSLMPGIAVEEGIRNAVRQKLGKEITQNELEEIAKQYGFTFKRQNRGNEDLRKIYEEIGITKAVSGHFHESSHRANDSKGNPLHENTYTSELFWNSGHGDAGHFGILEVDGSKVRYHNIKVGPRESKIIVPTAKDLTQIVSKK